VSQKGFDFGIREGIHSTVRKPHWICQLAERALGNGRATGKEDEKEY
jgi:hypothetical protein